MPFSKTFIYAFTLFAARGYAQSCNVDFDWSSLTPAPVLKWVPCYSAPLECSRLEVPLDYGDVNGAKAAIAMIRVPSTVPTNSTDYRGPILFNPGGPGGSGVSSVLQYSSLLQPRFDAFGSAYEFVTFDPRGVGQSTPHAQIYPDALHNAIWGETALASLLPALSIPGNIGLTLAKGQVTNAIFNNTAGSYLRHINTPNTATDMLQIIQAYGQEKLTYYGISYGSILGASFASAYPDKIERMVLDGVGDAEAYYAGNYTANMLETDQALGVFFQTCHEAGPDRCAFYDSSPSQISANFDALYDQLKNTPLAVFHDDTNHGIVDYTWARQYARTAMYSPYDSFPAYAEALALAQQGNGSALFALADSPNTFTCDCANVTNPDNANDALLAIACNDAVTTDRTSAEWEEFYASAAAVSKLSEVWVGMGMRCASWPVPNEDKISPKSVSADNTSFPILFVSNTIDPVTPGAAKMAALFPGSALLMQNATGHTSLAASSNCTTDAVAQYIVNGVLPAEGTVCQVDSGSFFP